MHIIRDNEWLSLEKVVLLVFGSHGKRSALRLADAREETNDLMKKSEDMGTSPFLGLLEMADEALDPSGANDGPVPVNVDPPTNGKVKAVCHFLWFICVLMKCDRLLDSTCGGMPWESRRVPLYLKVPLGSHHDRNFDQ